MLNRVLILASVLAFPGCKFNEQTSTDGGNSGTCTAEGQAKDAVPGALECCEGLDAIGCDTPDESGACPEGCAGAAVCAKCGNGECGPGENKCNCPRDCASTECERNEGMCIYFQDDCPEGYEPSGLECSNRSEQCCAPVAR